MLIYLFLINFLSFLLMKIDKIKAQHHAWRISEKTFFILALLGGSLGIGLAMYVFHHKTKHFTFIIGIPAIFIGQLILYFLLCWQNIL